MPGDTADMDAPGRRLSKGPGGPAYPRPSASTTCRSGSAYQLSPMSPRPRAAPRRWACMPRRCPFSDPNDRWQEGTSWRSAERLQRALPAAGDRCTGYRRRQGIYTRSRKTNPRGFLRLARHPHALDHQGDLPEPDRASTQDWRGTGPTSCCRPSMPGTPKLRKDFTPESAPGPVRVRRSSTAPSASRDSAAVKHPDRRLPLPVGFLSDRFRTT